MTVLHDAIAELSKAQKHLDKLGPLEDACAKAEEKLETMRLEIEETNKELSNAKAGLSASHVKNLRDYEEAIFSKSQQAKTLDARIASLQQRHDTLSVEVSSAETRHQQIADSISALRKQIG